VAEHRLFPEGTVPHVSTFAFHEHRDRAPHLEQPSHWLRLHVAGRFIREAAADHGTWSDLGCGDGGLLSVTQDAFRRAWGYDFQPSNAAGWPERGVTAYQLDVFDPANRAAVKLGSVVSCTEVLEHLADPHGVLAWLHDSPVTENLVCSSPVHETADAHDECHAWAWDADGYAAMVAGAGWGIRQHEMAGSFQVIWAFK
jgi:hypothetical protein